MRAWTRCALFSSLTSISDILLPQISVARDQKERGNSVVVKDRVLTWLPQVWNLKTKAVEGSFPFPVAKSDKSNRGVSNKIIALLLVPHAHLTEAFGKSSTKRTEQVILLSFLRSCS